MKKNNFKTPEIEQHNIDPLTELLLKQNSSIKKQIKELKANTVPKSEEIVKLGLLSINKISREVSYNDAFLTLSNQEYSLLLFFVNNVNRTVSFEEIGTSLFGSYIDSDRQNIMVYVNRLRNKLKVDDTLYSMLESVRGVGYIMTYHD